MTLLEGRRALVTGSTRGIGRAIAQRLSADGAFVVVHGRDPATAARVAAELPRPGAWVAGDLAATPDAADLLAREALRAAGGHLDMLVNNAALMTGKLPTADSDATLVESALRLGVAAPIAMVRACAPAMIARGRGVVVNIGSVNGEIGMAGFALYGACKGALHSLTRAWAEELGPHGIRVVTVAPGPTYTERNSAGAGRAGLEGLMAATPSGQPVTPDQVAATVAFVAGDEAAGLTGATLMVDGGYTAV